MSSTRECAYCGSKENLTKEHVIPDCINKRNPDQEISYFSRKNKIFGSDLTIKDVCEKCNNDYLSTLDQYICDLHDKYFSSYVETDEQIIFKYDYDLLLRSLLKILYNSSRVNKTRFKSLQKLKKYILHGENRPTHIKLYLKLITPYKLKFGELIKAPPEFKKTGKLPPEFTRVTTLSADIEKIDMPTVAFNSYYFMLAIPQKNITAQEQKEAISNLENLTDSPKQLLSKSDSLKTKGSSWDIAKVFKAQGLNSMKALLEYNARN
ncbi:HNH endonuclease [Fodinibius saliphilus]|uniref:HNH endonuclease n=1 Tax=Fodinibius saliphilus TaxID=1920650 RepID=UPI001108D485|nr:HNH endonuclease [Fodinibius saliphilus]